MVWEGKVGGRNRIGDTIFRFMIGGK